LKPRQITLRKASGRESHLTVTLTEGKNREIRRLMAAVGHEVTLLKRVGLGGLTLQGLRPGESRELTIEELRAAFPGAPLFSGRRPAKG
jgi:23S rRNA pseudouridine2605 synthase